MAGRSTMSATWSLMSATFSLLLCCLSTMVAAQSTGHPHPSADNIITTPFLTIVVFITIAGLIFMGGCIAAVVMVVRMTGRRRERAEPDYIIEEEIRDFD